MIESLARHLLCGRIHFYDILHLKCVSSLSEILELVLRTMRTCHRLLSSLSSIWSLIARSYSLWLSFETILLTIQLVFLLLFFNIIPLRCQTWGLCSFNQWSLLICVIEINHVWCLSISFQILWRFWVLLEFRMNRYWLSFVRIIITIGLLNFVKLIQRIWAHKVSFAFRRRKQLNWGA